MATSPSLPELEAYGVDLVVSAGGARAAVGGFETVAFRAKPAIAITANYVNHRTKEENVPEIAGISKQFHRGFFERLAEVRMIKLVLDLDGARLPVAVWASCTRVLQPSSWFFVVSFPSPARDFLQHGIGLENLVYYSGSTHYLVMTITKESLLGRGVLRQNFSLKNDSARLLDRHNNVDYDALELMLNDLGMPCCLFYVFILCGVVGSSSVVKLNWL